MQSKRDLAIVLKSIPYEERNRIVTALTENHGVVSALARNAIQSRRFGGTLEAFVASEWTFVEKPGTELLRLEGAIIRRAYDGLRADFERLSVASVMNELILKVAPKHEPCPDLFRLHANALAYLEEDVISGAKAQNQKVAGAIDGETRALLNGYLTKLLQWSGNQPQLERCLGCETSISQMQRHQSLSCIINDAGWICPSCRSSDTQHVRDREGLSFHHASLRVTPAAIRDFQMSLHLPIRQIPAAIEASARDHQELFKFLEALAIFHLPGFEQKPLKSLRFLDIESVIPGKESSPWLQ
jgi:recombinational DNA repair protein (RecF pathway)